MKRTTAFLAVLLVSQLVVLQAEVAWRTRVPETRQARRNMDIVLLNLRNLAGLPRDADLRLQGSLDDYPPLPPDGDLGGALDARADYRALQAQHRLRQIGVDAARALSFPVVAASLIYGFSAQSDQLKVEQDNNALQVQINVSVPICTGGVASFQVARAEINLDKKRQEIAIQLDELSLRLREANERVSTARAIVATADKALAIAASSGLATQLDLKDAQVSSDSARLGHIAAIFDYLNAWFDWEQATGRMERLSARP